MLVLTRRPSEVIHIGPDIKVTLFRLGTGSARLGIDAPPELIIVRGELLEDGKPASSIREQDND